MLGSFSPEALEAYTQQVVKNSPAVDFSENDTYDFTRCVRSNGTAYGTGGRCRLGTEEAKQAEARKAQVAKADRARQQNKDNKAKLEAAFDKGAQHYGRMLRDDDPEKEVKIRAMRNMIKSLFENGSKETASDIAEGDFDKVFNHLRSIQDLDKKAYMREKRAEARKKSVAMNKEIYGKDMKSKDPKVAAKAKADAKHYVDREAERAKIAAGREHDEAFSIVRALNNAQKD